MAQPTTTAFPPALRIPCAADRQPVNKATGGEDVHLLSWLWEDVCTNALPPIEALPCTFGPMCQKPDLTTSFHEQRPEQGRSPPPPPEPTTLAPGQRAQCPPTAAASKPCTGTPLCMRNTDYKGAAPWPEAGVRKNGGAGAVYRTPIASLIDGGDLLWRPRIVLFQFGRPGSNKCTS